MTPCDPGAGGPCRGAAWIKRKAIWRNLTSFLLFDRVHLCSGVLLLWHKPRIHKVTGAHPTTSGLALMSASFPCALRHPETSPMRRTGITWYTKSQWSACSKDHKHNPQSLRSEHDWRLPSRRHFQYHHCWSPDICHLVSWDKLKKTVPNLPFGHKFLGKCQILSNRIAKVFPWHLPIISYVPFFPLICDHPLQPMVFVMSHFCQDSVHDVSHESLRNPVPT